MMRQTTMAEAAEAVLLTSSRSVWQEAWQRLKEKHPDASDPEIATAFKEYFMTDIKRMSIRTKPEMASSPGFWQGFEAAVDRFILEATNSRT